MSKTHEKRGNINAPDTIIKKIKVRAAQEGKTIREFTEPFLKALADGKINLAEMEVAK